MMKNTKFLLQAFIALLILNACKPDDGPGTIAVRDAAEVYAEDLVELQSFLDTHFYNYEEFQANPTADLEVLFDTIAAANSSKIPLSQQVETKTLRRSGIDYNYFILRTRQGDGDGRATFADSALVSYKGYLTNKTVFDSSTNAIWFDLPQAIDGFVAGVSEFNDATAAVQQPDGVITFAGSGIGAVFIPSGIAYINQFRTGIPSYSPLIFTFKVRKVVETDHDSDGILSKYEDLNGDFSVRTSLGDNTDSDTSFNYLDVDDDGDGIPTIFENADPNGDGNPDDAEDLDGDGIPGYLDADETNLDLDGDGVLTRFESPDPNGNGNPSDAQDTDNDGIPDYLDPDDDGDGIPTSQENADPNRNGNPSDARDTDGDGIPDYLDPDS